MSWTIIAIHESTGHRHTVPVDGWGRVPRGYRTETAGEVWAGRVASLREEMARLSARGDVTGAASVRRTLIDMGAA